MDMESFIGRQQIQRDVADPMRIQKLAELLDHSDSPWQAGVLPPLGHWLHFLPVARQSTLGADGHPRLGDFLPDLGLPRRMWAGGRIEFLNEVPLGTVIERRSTITSIKEKSGAAGQLVFVTVNHEISANGTPAIVEEQDLVYRDIGVPSDAPGTPAKSGNSERSMQADPMMLFRYSALTFNSHRIHYDRDYARDVELYPGLVVHGPYIATLLTDHFLAQTPDARVRKFGFRAQRPLYDGAEFTLCSERSASGADLWSRDSSGCVTMTAQIECL